MDRTSEFKATVKKKKGSTPKKDIIKPIKRKSAFEEAARKIGRKILDVSKELEESRAGYLDLNRNVKSVGVMSEERKDQLDAEATASFREIEASIEQLRPSLAECRNDAKYHREGILAVLGLLLSKCRLLHKEMKAFRVKSKMEKKEFSMFSSVQSTLNEIWQSSQPKQDGMDGSLLPVLDQQEAIIDPTAEGLFTQSEQLQFEEESKVWLAEFQSSIDQIREAEKQVLEISRLQVILETHALEQAKQIENLHEEAVGTTETIKKGNQILKDVKKNASESRKLVLFVLILASSALLFLDWFN